jgi:hypothetical protein
MTSPFVGKAWQWRRLCRAAVVEQDPEKLAEIVQTINAKLGMRQRMLRGRGKQSQPAVIRFNSRLGRVA